MHKTLCDEGLNISVLFFQVCPKLKILYSVALCFRAAR